MEGELVGILSQLPAKGGKAGRTRHGGELDLGADGALPAKAVQVAGEAVGDVDRRSFRLLSEPGPESELRRGKKVTAHRPAGRPAQPLSAIEPGGRQLGTPTVEAGPRGHQALPGGRFAHRPAKPQVVTGPG